jgi:ParB-like chromosome segregation protein Spo0J
MSIGELTKENYSPDEIAEFLQQPVSLVLQLLTSLRSELALQTGFLPLTDPEYEALKASIDEFGIQVPVLMGQHMPIVDGINRWNIAIDLNLTEIPIVVLQGLTAQQEHDLSLTLNIARRQLDATQRREIVRSELWRDWGRSDNMVAALCGVSHQTVGRVRTAMWDEREGTDLESLIAQAEEQVSEEDEQKFQDSLDEANQLVQRTSSEKRLGADGKTRKMPERKPKEASEPEVEPESRPFDWEKDAPEIGRIAPTGKKHFATCPNCASMLTVHFDGSEYSLTHDRD